MLHEAIRLDPQESYFFWRGRIYQDLGDYRSAIDDFTRAIKLNPNDAYNFQSRGINYAFEKDYVSAIEDYTSALELMPDNDRHLYLRAQAYFEWGKYEDAIEDYTAAIEQNPSHKNYYEIRGFAYHRLERYEEALDDFHKCVTLQPQNTLCFYWRGVMSLNTAQYEPAIHDMNMSESLDAEDAVSKAYCSFWRAVAYTKLNEPAQADNELLRANQALRTVEEESQYWRIQGILHLFNGDEELAKSAYQRVLDDDNRATKLFSPLLYLLQLTRLFPENKLYKSIYDWFESQVE
jgi:tetratricopeptide (TPR) repeat protein